MIYYFDEVTSTIDLARKPEYLPGDVIVAEYQSAGRGQRGHRWGSPKGLNLMFSIISDTGFLAANEQFLFLQCVALALVDMFRDFGIGAKVKWTNDIYVGDRKITGVLIDHSLNGNRLSRSNAGIGINVNQTVFDEWIPNPTSMKLLTDSTLDRNAVLECFCRRFASRFELLRSEEGKLTLRNGYNELLYRRDLPARYRLADGTEFTGTVLGVEPDGSLLVKDDTHVGAYLYGEISYVI